MQVSGIMDIVFMLISMGLHKLAHFSIFMEVLLCSGYLATGIFSGGILNRAALIVCAPMQLMRKVCLAANAVLCRGKAVAVRSAMTHFAAYRPNQPYCAARSQMRISNWRNIMRIDRKTRVSAVFLTLMLFVCLFMPAAAAKEAPTPQAAAVFMADPESDFILYQMNPDEQRYPASTTKIMTALIVLETVENLDELVTIMDEDFIGVEADTSKAGFKVGEQVSVLDLLYGLMLPSGNEAANTLARHVGGSIEGFVELMNKRAQELGCENTHFNNPNGLHDDEHYTTARDLYKIAKQAMQDETFQTIVSTAQKTLKSTEGNAGRSKPLKVYTTNMLIYSRQKPEFYTYAKGIKTGYTSLAGYCLVAAAERKGSTLISVMMGCEKPAGAEQPLTFSQTKDLFEWGFTNFKNMTLIEKGKIIKQIEVRLSTEDDKLVLVAEDDLNGTVPSDIDLEELNLTYDVPESVDAPIKAGDKIGSVDIAYNGIEYGSVNLIALSDVTRSNVLYYADAVEHFFQGPLFRFLVLLLIALFFVYFGIIFYRGQMKRIRRKKMMRSKEARYRDYDRRNRP